MFLQSFGDEVVKLAQKKRKKKPKRKQKLYGHPEQYRNATPAQIRKWTGRDMPLEYWRAQGYKLYSPGAKRMQEFGRKAFREDPRAHDVVTPRAKQAPATEHWQPPELSLEEKRKMEPRVVGRVGPKIEWPVGDKGPSVAVGKMPSVRPQTYMLGEAKKLPRLPGFKPPSLSHRLAAKEPLGSTKLQLGRPEYKPPEPTPVETAAKKDRGTFEAYKSQRSAYRHTKPWEPRY